MGFPINVLYSNRSPLKWWLGSRMVSALDSVVEGPGFKSQPLSGNSLRQTVHTHRASVHQAAKLVAALLRVAGVTASLMTESNGNPTFCNRVWASFTF